MEDVNLLFEVSLDNVGLEVVRYGKLNYRYVENVQKICPSHIFVVHLPLLKILKMKTLGKHMLHISAHD